MRSFITATVSLFVAAALCAGGALLLPRTAQAEDAANTDATDAAQPAAAPAAGAGPAGAITEDGVITGTVQIDFGTRTNLDNTGKLTEGSPAKGAQDKYRLDLRVAKTTEFAGDITRHPNLFSRTIRKQEQAAQLAFYLGIKVINPRNESQKKQVGTWTGTVPIDTKTGAFLLAGGKNLKEPSPLRIQIDSVGTAKGFTDYFAGKLVGKAENKDNLGEYTYNRLVGKKKVEFKVAKVDPMRFEGVELAKGPAEVYPHTRVDGRLDYDYETGNWITDGITFTYNLNGKEVKDKVTGTIKWLPDEDRATSGKGRYDFNLRFNEDQVTPAEEGDPFADLPAEEAFFAVDENIPTLTGTVEYVDTFVPGSEELPAKSTVTYNLNANKLTKQQIMNFFKLWVLCTGPANDE